MGETADLAPVITVDWQAVEADLDTDIGADLRRVIEHEGSALETALDRWSYASESTTALFTAVRKNARIIHPERGALDARYAPFDSMSAAVSVFKHLRGADLNIGTVIENGDDAEFVDGLADLYDAARALDERRDDQSVIEGINVEDLPVEREHAFAHGQESHTSEEHYTASFRHERYYPEDTEPTVADERAAEIGFLGSNAGKRTLEQDFRENDIEHREVGTVELGPADPDATLYRYEKDDETRYGVEWSQRIAIDDYVVRSLIFDEKPDHDAVATALTIEDHRQDEKFGGQR